MASLELLSLRPLAAPRLLRVEPYSTGSFANKDAPLQFDPALLFWSAAVLVWNKVVR